MNRLIESEDGVDPSSPLQRYSLSQASNESNDPNSQDDEDEEGAVVNNPYSRSNSTPPSAQANPPPPPYQRRIRFNTAQSNFLKFVNVEFSPEESNRITLSEKILSHMRISSEDFVENILKRYPSDNLLVKLNDIFTPENEEIKALISMATSILALLTKLTIDYCSLLDEIEGDDNPRDKTIEDRFKAMQSKIDQLEKKLEQKNAQGGSVSKPPAAQKSAKVPDKVNPTPPERQKAQEIHQEINKMHLSAATLDKKVKAKFGFTVDPTLHPSENVENIIMKSTTRELYPEGLANLSCHNLCSYLTPPSGFENLLGLGFNFCIKERFPGRTIDTSRFLDDLRNKIFFGQGGFGDNDNDIEEMEDSHEEYDPKFKTRSPGWIPPSGPRFSAP